jgi:hypothetical protein
LNLPDIRVLKVKMDEKTIECEIESTPGASLCHKCGEQATVFHEHERALELRHLPLCGRQVILSPTSQALSLSDLRSPA